MNQWGLIPIHAILLFSCLCHIQAQEIEINECSRTPNYTRNSAFHTNLNNLLSSLLLSNGSLDSYYNATIGASPDTVYGLVSCRGDLPVQDCRACLVNATANITQLCPTGREATLRYQNCLVRYSNRPFFSQINVTAYIFQSMVNVSAADLPRYHTRLGELMRNLSNRAISSPLRYASGWAAYTDFDEVYGLVQCTRDLSPTTCFSCLQNMYTTIPRCCEDKIGARIISPTCAIRYEITPFTVATPEAPPSMAPPSVVNRRRNSVNVAVILVPVIAGILLVQFCAYMIIRRRRKTRKRKRNIDYDGDMSSEESLQFDLDTIIIATNNFSEDNKLGQGGFGAVYKGELFNGREIAVKRLSENSGQGLQEFKTEVMLLHKLQHRNLVKLFGFCYSGEEKLLIYEYIPNGSLDRYIFDPTKKAELDWETRYKIIVGIARGLVYLHEDSRLRIIHRDLKAGNILLDNEMNPKIADFGMAKLFGVDQTQGNTSRIAGTFGYMAPEYALNGLFSVKSDVFSFGVLLLEIVSGLKTNDLNTSGSRIDLLPYVWKLWREGNAVNVRDPALVDPYSATEVMRCVHIGLLCVQENSEERPTMSSVLLMLSSYSYTLNSPAPPAFIIQTRTDAGDPFRDFSLADSTDSKTFSGDETSLTIPR